MGEKFCEAQSGSFSAPKRCIILVFQQPERALSLFPSIQPWSGTSFMMEMLRNGLQIIVIIYYLWNRTGNLQLKRGRTMFNHNTTCADVYLKVTNYLKPHICLKCFSTTLFQSLKLSFVTKKKTIWQFWNNQTRRSKCWKIRTCYSTSWLHNKGTDLL